jgi:molybdate-binding protein
LLRRLRADRDALVRFVTRTQGLILPRGNPRRIRSLADVATHGLSIVNRQPGSGTRLLFDRLLAAARIAPTAVPGYSREEFTHAAVAATVAAGGADVGFGVEAAAAQLGLAFVPLVRERYRFACRKRALDGAPMMAFRALLAGDATRAAVTPLRGYRLDAPGRVAALR